MNLITIENISKSYGEKLLLNNSSLGINEGEKIGLIGINGTGKSTLLKIIGGVEQGDTGKVIKGNQVRVEYLAQNPSFDPEATVLEQVFMGNSKEMKLLREYEGLLQKLANEELDIAREMQLNKQLMYLQNQIDDLKLWDLESEVKSILTKLDIQDYNAKIATLSGGGRKRVALASALIKPCDLLILDEPTNHMDSDSIAWLENYLNNRKGALLMITHDRYFLDVVTNRIIELDHGNLYSYEGNYSLFVEKKIEREALEEASQKKKANLFKKELAWIKRGAKARSTKQKARIQRFNELKDEMVTSKDDKMELSVLGSRLGKKIIELKDISKSYDNKVVIKDFSYIILKDDRIGIVGPNGIGKSTLMNIICGKIKADSGELEQGETVKLGYFSQENDNLDDSLRVIDYVKDIGEYLPLSNGDRISASKMLERFLFPPDLQYNLIGHLSGGEKRRLYLLGVLMSAPNLLLLDEPTNDLDIETLRILEDFLDTFNGPVLTVSHDRYFLDRVCHKIFAFEAAGNIKTYHGNYSDYLMVVDHQPTVEEENKTKKDVKSQVKINKNDKEKPLKFTYKEQLEFNDIDDVIEDLENKISVIDEDMEKYATDFMKVSELLKEKETLEATLSEKYDRWTYLNELSEKIEEQKRLKNK